MLIAGAWIINGDVLASAELYDPASGTWTATGSLANARGFHTATLLPNGKVLVAGGVGSDFSSLTSAELYDPTSGTWTATGSLATARERHTATLLPNGKVLAAGGFFNIASAELYDPASGTWTATGSLASAREGHTIVANDDWKEAQQIEITGSGLAPTNDKESAILITLGSGAYTAIVRGQGNTTGVGLVEIYNLN